MMSILLLGRSRWMAAAMILSVATAAPAQVIRPAAPAEYDAVLRFQIRAPLPGWYDQYDDMIAALKHQGFRPVELPEGEPVDPSDDRLAGVVSATDARKLLQVAAVRTILLRPRGINLNPADRVKVRLHLAAGLGLEAQRALSRQVVGKLLPLGFTEAMGYHHAGFVLVVGTMEAARLDELLTDLRTLPRGWLVPEEPISTLPMPLRNQVPVRIVEVLPTPADVPAAGDPPAPPAIPEEAPYLAKIAPSLRAAIGPDKDDTKLLRVEVVLAHTPSPDDLNWERLLRAAGASVVIEGRLGNVAAVLVNPVQAAELARPDAVVHVRLPVSAEPLRRPPLGESVNARADTRLHLLHQRGYRGAGVKVLVVGGDFGGWERLKGRALPSATLVDFTAPRNPTIEPDPMPSTDGAIGSGTIAALAVAEAAPDADLVLVRIDPAAPHQLMLIAQVLNEPGTLPRVLEARYNELVRDRALIETDRTRFIEERRRAYDERVFDEGDPAVPESRRRFQESEERIRRAEANLKDLERRQLELDQRTQRFLARRADLDVIRGARVVVSTLTWEAGYPVDGANALARYLDEKPFVGHPGDPTNSRIQSLVRNRGTIWVQAAGDSRGQVWCGLFRDTDGNGAMEFAPPGMPLPRGRWTSELNFLGWEEFGHGYSWEVPRPTRVRAALQWREPHDRNLFHSLDDPYRTPNASFLVTVLRQRDPSGTQLDSDDMEIVAQSDGLPVRLVLDPSMGSYEVSAEFDAVPGARYALRVDGRVPNSVRPVGEAEESSNLPLEIRPRLTLLSNQSSGRPVYLDYGVPGPLQPGEQLPGVGMPADARSALTVGAADASGRPQYYSSAGAGPNRQMLIKPDVMAFDAMRLPANLQAGGSWVAAAFEGGLAACLLQMDAPAQPRLLLPLLDHQPGAVLRIPESWLR